jgi:hypothetical protein
MSIQFPCACGRVLQVEEGLAGKRVRCPSCSRIVWAPPAEEVVPEARLVDGPHAPKAEPVAAAAPPPVEAPSPAPAAADGPVSVKIDPPAPTAEPAASCCATKSDCGAVAGFAVSLASLVFGVVTVTFPLSWPAGGLGGALLSARALRRVREGKASPASAGMARAGLAIGLGQAFLAMVLWIACAGICLKERGCCPFSRASCGGVRSTRTEVRDPEPLKVVPAGPTRVQQPPPTRVQQPGRTSEATGEESK